MILVTGGLGYIGSHFIVQLLKEDTDLLIIDNLSNSKLDNLKFIENLTKKKINFIECDTRDKKNINKIFLNETIDTIIHFAGLKSISESFEKSSEYFSNNISGTSNLLDSALKNNVNNFIFSSSATVYGNKHPSPWKESQEIKLPESPYAISKIVSEKILENASRFQINFKVGVLRYFNPIGYHESGYIGENIATSKNLIPAIINYLLGNSKILNVYGNDYETHDGSCVRDYVHINDLVDGHLKALKYIKNSNKNFDIWNLGSGCGYSVFQIINIFEKLTNSKIKISMSPRRNGDLPYFWADISKAKKELNWAPVKHIEEMIADSLNHYNYLSKTN
tara:strand:+ start:39 stop:1046 length:1008 start_codon:yes stop_codon:yes gene_type:complete